MARYKGTFNFSNNFEVLNKAPLDARLVVDTRADLIDPSTWKDSAGLVWLFKGIIVSVVSDSNPSYNGPYFLTDETSYTSYSSWVKLETGASGTSLLVYDASIIGDNVTTVFPIIHNLNTMRQNITISDAMTNAIIYPGITIGSSTNYISFFTPPSTSEVYNVHISSNIIT